MTKSEIRRVDSGRSEVLDKVIGIEDVTFGHLLMIESVLSALEMDTNLVTDVAMIYMKSKKEKAA